jgi:hypothetical protein
VEGLDRMTAVGLHDQRRARRQFVHVFKEAGRQRTKYLRNAYGTHAKMHQLCVLWVTN